MNCRPALLRLKFRYKNKYDKKLERKKTPGRPTQLGDERRKRPKAPYDTSSPMGALDAYYKCSTRDRTQYVTRHMQGALFANTAG